MSELLMAFYGDDFTGSTDAMESLARAGIRTVLFTHPPTRADLDAIQGLQAFGVAGRTRAMSPTAMHEELTRSFISIREAGAPIVHYKVCSTFDSSQSTGSIGCAMDVGAEIFRTRCVPIVGGAPHLGRHCVFGTLFVKGNGDASPLRLDRHPNMRNHPVTPMCEADLRLHLSTQTNRSIALLDVVQLDSANVDRRYGQILSSGHGAVLIDYLSEAQSHRIGMLLQHHSRQVMPLFVVGSSGVESALTAHWTLDRPHASRFPPAEANGPLLVAVGSCSPVTARQIAWAEANGFGTLLIQGHESDDLEAVRDASLQLEHGRSVVIHTGGASSSDRLSNREQIGAALAHATRTILERTGLRRLLVAGGDTSGQIASVLGIRSLEMVGELVRGAPLCRATSPHPFVEGLEVVFKGGQIGGDDFFGLVQNGTTGIHP